MFSFFKKKAPPPEAPVTPNPPIGPATASPPEADVAELVSTTAQPTEPAKRSWLDRFRQTAPIDSPSAPPTPAEPLPAPSADATPEARPSAPRAKPEQPPVLEGESEPSSQPMPRARAAPPSASTGTPPSDIDSEDAVVVLADADIDARRPWFDRLKLGLKRTGSGIAQVFTGARIDEALYEELEAALLMADAGVQATEHLLADLKRRVKDARATDPAMVKALLADAVAALLEPLEKALVIGETEPTVIMVAGVNGAGKTTTIGKLTRHFAEGGVKVLLAAADTFRAAAREQLGVWADRNRVEIVSQEGGDPAAVSFDAVKAGQARGCDVVIADTAGRLPTQLHLMDELKKIQRTIGKAMSGAPHEVLLVIDGNTGQNALAQVKAFDAALGLTGLIVTKLDGTAKGGVLAAIALWSRERERGGRGAVPVYFVGVGEKLEDLQTFSAREFAHALLS
jgi:fused signal recognition particle receptor